jgi:hypothetical protein
MPNAMKGDTSMVLTDPNGGDEPKHAGLFHFVIEKV